MVNAIQHGGTVLVHCSSMFRATPSSILTETIACHSIKFDTDAAYITCPITAGIASSTLVATAYLMAAFNLDPYAAYTHVQGRRYCASLSPVSILNLCLQQKKVR